MRFGDDGLDPILAVREYQPRLTLQRFAHVDPLAFAVDHGFGHILDMRD